MKRHVTRGMLYLVEVVIFVLLSIAVLIFTLQQDAPTKFICYNF